MLKTWLHCVINSSGELLIIGIWEVSVCFFLVQRDLWLASVRGCRWPQFGVLLSWFHDDVIKWKHFPRYWPLVRGIRAQYQWRGALTFSLICARIYDWVNNREADDLGRYRAHYDVTVMYRSITIMEHSAISTPYIAWYRKLAGHIDITMTS